MSTSTTKSILQMARGAIEERFDYEMTRVIENILDLNTKATAKRKITLTVEIEPDDSRETLTVKATAKSSLAPTSPIATSLFLQTDGDFAQAWEMTPQIPGQRMLDGGEQEAPAQLKLVQNA